MLGGWITERMNSHQKIWSLMIAMCLAFSNSIVLSSPAFANSKKNKHNWLIAKPKDKVLNSKTRVSRVLHNNHIKYRKINKTTYLVSRNKNKRLKAQIKELEKTGLFEYVEPDYKLDFDARNYTTITKHTDNPPTPVETETSIVLQDVTPNDKSFNSQYYLRQIKATKAWSVSVGEGVTVAVLDSGVDGNHQDLIGKVTSGNGAEDLVDTLGHGTEVSGIIAANTNNTTGIAGIGWKTNVLSLMITDESGQARVSTVVNAFDTAYEKGAKIIHISLSTNQYSRTLEAAVQEAHARGILVVSTSGNTGKDQIRYPSGFDGVIGVGAVNAKNELESYSTTGEHVSLVAPGTGIFTTNPKSQYKSVTGTSFAAPQVTGTAALIWAVNPELTSDEVRSILFKSATDLGNNGRDYQYGHGLLNTEKAVELAENLNN